MWEKRKLKWLDEVAFPLRVHFIKNQFNGLNYHLRLANMSALNYAFLRGLAAPWIGKSILGATLRSSIILPLFCLIVAKFAAFTLPPNVLPIVASLANVDGGKPRNVNPSVIFFIYYAPSSTI